jgi:hypothetical protein
LGGLFQTATLWEQIASSPRKNKVDDFR